MGRTGMSLFPHPFIPLALFGMTWKPSRKEMTLTDGTTHHPTGTVIIEGFWHSNIEDREKMSVCSLGGNRVVRLKGTRDDSQRSAIQTIHPV